MEKCDVNGPNEHMVFKWLKHHSDFYDRETNQVKDIKDDFTKFLVNGKGEVVATYDPQIQPKNICSEIEKYIDRPPTE